MEGKLTSFGKKATKVGKALTTNVSKPAMEMGKAVINGAGLLEEQMITLQGLTDKTAEGLKPLRDQAIALGKSTVFYTNQVAAGQVTLTKAGLDLNQVLTATPQILDFASSSETDFAEAAKGALDVLKGQNLKVQDLVRGQPALVRVTDMLTLAAKSATVETSELIDAFGAGGSTASMFGMEMEETAAVFALLAEQGTRGAAGGTALRQAIVRLVSPATDARDVFKELKLVQSDFFSDDGEEKFLGMANALDKLEGARPSQLFTIFGEKAGPNFLKVAAAGSEKMRELTSTYQQNGVTAKIAGLRTQGIGGKLKMLGSALSGAGQAAADSGLSDWFKEMVTFATFLVDQITLMNPKWIKWGVVAIGLAAALGPVLLIAGQIGLGLAGLMSFMTTVAIPVFGAVATMITGTVVPAITAMTVAMLANPVGLIVAGVLALIAALVLLYKNSETVRDVMDAVWNGILKLVNMVWNEIEGFFVAIAEGTRAVAGFFGYEGDGPAAGADPAALSASQIVGVAGGGSTTHTKQSKLEISMRDIAPGTQVTTDQLDEEVELSLGYAMGGAV
jgi:TP901 family phage tail tape measure protein